MANNGDHSDQPGGEDLSRFYDQLNSTTWGKRQKEEVKTMPKHTPGPWFYRQVPEDSRETNRSFWIDDKKHSPVADIFNTGRSKRAEYNAALIAAAPDMLKTLEFTLKALEGMSTSQFRLGAVEPIRERLRQAIKATLPAEEGEEEETNGR